MRLIALFLCFAVQTVTARVSCSTVPRNKLKFVCQIVSTTKLVNEPFISYQCHDCMRSPSTCAQIQLCSALAEIPMCCRRVIGGILVV